MTSRRTFLSLFAASTAAVLAGCGDDQDEPASGGSTAKVTFGYIGDYNGSSLPAIAGKQKLWESTASTPR